jgi:hypothetical protein
VHWVPGIPGALLLSRDVILAEFGRHLRREDAESHPRLFENRIREQLLVVPDKRAMASADPGPITTTDG